MTRVMGPLLVLLFPLLLGSCGEAPDPDAGVLCFRHEAEPQWSHRWGGDYVQVYEVALFPGGRYGSFATIPPGPSAMGPSFGAGRWAAKDGKITFVPDMWTSAFRWRRYYWTRYEPGTRLEWVVEPQHKEPGSGRYEPDEYKPPGKTVMLERVPPGDLPARAREAERRAWADYLPVYEGSPFEYEDED